MSLEWGNRYRQDVTGGNAAYLDQLTELRRLLYRCRGSHRVNRRAPPRLLRRDPARGPLWAGPVGARRAGGVTSLGGRPLARWATRMSPWAAAARLSRYLSSRRSPGS